MRKVLSVSVQRANPAGNITLYVLDHVAPEERPRITAYLMAQKELQTEQIAYCCPPIMGGEGRIEMAGGEFCGNAARAFAMLLQQKRQLPTSFSLEVSGCDHLVEVQVEGDKAQAQMPLPKWVRTVKEVDGVLVHLGGIAHLVVKRAPSEEFLNQMEGIFQEIPSLDAYGVMFLTEPEGTMVPLVKVPAAHTLVWEGSCGSGTLAASIAMSMHEVDGTFSYSWKQPSGTVEATIEKRDGQVIAARIGGLVELDEPITVDVGMQ